MGKTLELNDPKALVLFEDLSTLKCLTCRNHSEARYLTKNPWVRGLHFIKADPEVGKECPCPFSDLVLLVADDDDVSTFLRG
jgi:hypothetical protein